MRRNILILLGLLSAVLWTASGCMSLCFKFPPTEQDADSATPIEHSFELGTYGDIMIGTLVAQHNRDNNDQQSTFNMNVLGISAGLWLIDYLIFSTMVYQKSEDNNKAEEGECGVPVNGLQCWISSNKETYRAGEEIVLKGEIKNCGDKSFSILGDRNLTSTWIRLKVLAYNKTKFHYGSDKMLQPIEINKTQFISIRPGEQYGIWEVHAKAGSSLEYLEPYQKDEILPAPFKEKVEYKMWFTYEPDPLAKFGFSKVSPRIWSGTARSNVITIKITD